MAADRDLCARCGNQFPAAQVCDGCRAAGVMRRFLAWLGQLGTCTLGTVIGFSIGHLLGLI